MNVRKSLLISKCILRIEWSTIGKRANQHSSTGLTLDRVDLHDALKEAATQETQDCSVVIRTGCVVKNCDPDAGNVTLESGEVVTGDLIIGADGM